MALVLLLLEMSERQLKAYADPGSGALIWQMLVVGFVGSLYYMRRFFGRVKEWFGRKNEPHN